MLVGNLPLNHPTLSVRPEFRAQLPNQKNAQVILFPVEDGVDLSGTLKETVQLNTVSAKTMAHAHQEYTQLKAAGGPARSFMEATHADLLANWKQMINNHSQQSLQVAATLASQATHVLGSVIMAGFTQRGEGVVEIELHNQTSSEGIINSASDLSYLTGDHYTSQAPGGIRGGKVQVSQPMYNDNVAGYLIVDTTRGMAALRKATAQ